MKKSFIRAITIASILACILGFIGYHKAMEESKLTMSETVAATDPSSAVVLSETEHQTPTNEPVLDCESLEAVCADSFMDPSKVTVLGGEWAYTADPNKFVALATVRYTTKDDVYETAEFIIVGTFGGKAELLHNLNEHSPYTAENALQEFGAIDNQRFPLEQENR